MAVADRGQAHTLEAVAAGIVLLSAVVFALNVTAVTPLSGSTSNQHIENQQGDMAEGLLASEAENGTLRETLLYWNETEEEFHGADGRRGEYLGTVPPTAFGRTLQETFLNRGIAVNVNLYSVRSNGDRRPIPVVHLGSPSDHASTATWQVTLFDSDELLDAGGDPTGTTVGEAGDFYASNDVDGASDVYNVVEVEVIVWRM